MEAVLPEINQRLSSLIDHFANGSRKKFAEMIGVSPQVINRNFNLDPRSDEPKYPIVSTSIIDKIIGNLKNLNTEWLLTGEGSMLKSDIKSQDEYLRTNAGVKYKELGNGRYQMTVPFVPRKAYAKYIDEIRDAEEVDYETYDFIVDKIGLGEYFAFEIKGDSMDDDSKRSISDGDIVLARKLKNDLWRDKLHIDRYKYWIIVTDSTIVCKEIISHDIENGEIVCHSLNPSGEYSDFTLKLDEVKQLYNIIQRVSTYF